MSNKRLFSCSIYNFLTVHRGKIIPSVSLMSSNLDIISDRVAVLYNLLYEDKGDDEDEEKEDDGEEGEQNGELLDLVNDVLADIYEYSLQNIGNHK